MAWQARKSFKRLWSPPVGRLRRGAEATQAALLEVVDHTPPAVPQGRRWSGRPIAGGEIARAVKSNASGATFLTPWARWRCRRCPAPRRPCPPARTGAAFQASACSRPPLPIISTFICLVPKMTRMPVNTWPSHILIGGGDDLLVTDGAAGLDDNGYAGLTRVVDPSRNGKKASTPLPAFYLQPGVFALMRRCGRS